MKVTLDVGERRITLALAAGDVPDRSALRTTYRPDRVDIEFQRRGVWFVRIIVMSGFRLLARGRPGRTRVEETLNRESVPEILLTWINAKLLELNGGK